jgi:hypothetical protein
MKMNVFSDLNGQSQKIVAWLSFYYELVVFLDPVGNHLVGIFRRKNRVGILQDGPG